MDGSHRFRCPANIELFLQEFRELGYVEGKNMLSSIDTLMISSTGSLRWLMSWSVSRLMSSLSAAPLDRRCQEHNQNDPNRFFKRT